ncbi:hypothetical protein QTP88_000293 [Uroleucon formosanum]
MDVDDYDRSLWSKNQVKNTKNKQEAVSTINISRFAVQYMYIEGEGEGERESERKRVIVCETTAETAIVTTLYFPTNSGAT